MKTQIQKLKEALINTPTISSITLNKRSYLYSSELKILVKIVEYKTSKKFFNQADKNKINQELLGLRDTQDLNLMGYSVFFISNLNNLDPQNKKLENFYGINFISTSQTSNEKILTRLNPFYSNKTDFAARVAYGLLGLAAGLAAISFVPSKNIDMLEELSVQQAKVFFLRGCTMSNTIDVCKKQPAFTDSEEIYKKVQDLSDAEANFKPAKKNKGEFDAETNKELQKIMQGRTPVIRI